MFTSINPSTQKPITQECYEFNPVYLYFTDSIHSAYWSMGGETTCYAVALRSNKDMLFRYNVYELTNDGIDENRELLGGFSQFEQAKRYANSKLEYTEECIRCDFEIDDLEVSKSSPLFTFPEILEKHFNVVYESDRQSSFSLDGIASEISIFRVLAVKEKGVVTEWVVARYNYINHAIHGYEEICTTCETKEEAISSANSLAEESYVRSQKLEWNDNSCLYCGMNSHIGNGMCHDCC